MSLFIGSLAFTTADVMNAVRLGVVLGSVLSGIIGYLLLKSAAHHSAK
jgi:NhaA family Na+:H+ antiporter